MPHHTHLVLLQEIERDKCRPDSVEKIMFWGDVMLSKIDISPTFHNLHVDQMDYDFLGVIWYHHTYLDASVPMEMQTGNVSMYNIHYSLFHGTKER